MYKSAVCSLLILFAISSCFAQTDAKTQFTRSCSVCHGADGKAQTVVGKSMKAVDLTAPATQSKSDADLYNVIARGRGKMAAYEGILGKPGIESLVKYIRNLKK